MHKNQNSYRSLDGFTPRRSVARQIGFEATDVNRPRPGVTRSAAASTFPQIGQTIASYAPAQGVSPGAAISPTSRTLPGNTAAKSPDAKRQKRWQFWRNRKFWKRFVITVVAFFLLVGAWLGFKFLYNTYKIFHGNIFGIFSTTKLRGEDTGRVNILLAGNSSDDAGHSGGQLTDSIMIISINTKNNTAFMLSIPRDLWVDIPGYGHAKINEAYVDGQNGNFNQSGYFPGGMGLLQQVIEQNFDINLNYYALVDYSAMRDAVNAVGGIDIDIKSTDPRGLYDPSIDYATNGPLVKLSNGWHHLNGEQALDLARARGDSYYSYGFPQSDFDRTAHQRQELLALRSKVLSAGTLANPVKLSSFMDALGNNVKTDFSLSEVHRLYDLTKDLGGNKIQSLSLNDDGGRNLLTSYVSPEGQSALIPAAGLDDFSDIETFIKHAMSTNPVVRENARIVILNATDTGGLAAKASNALTAQGLNVIGVADASANQATTSIIDASDGQDPATKALLVQKYGNHVTTTDPYSYDADFIVLLGADRVPATTADATTQ